MNTSPSFLRRALRLLLALALIPAFAPAQDYAPSYYGKMDGKQKEALKAAAKECVQSHKRLNYQTLPEQWQYSDVYPELVDGCKRWWEMYSNNVYLIRQGQSALGSYSANKMQREHSVPKSWWKKNNDVEYTPAYSDMWNLYPSDGPANQAKLNYPLGEVYGTPGYDNGSCKVGGAVTGQGGGSAKVFEPADEYKGDFARSFFYMATVYDDLPWVINYMFQTEAWPTLRPWAVDMLLQWARRDPVSQKEIVRNNEVEKSQGNRNPFIDFPELAEYIWGTRVYETFYIAEQGGNVTPPITGDPVLTAPVDGSSLDFPQTAVGGENVAYLEFSGANFTQPLSVRVNGDDAAMFIPEDRNIFPGAINTRPKYLFPISFAPGSEGIHEATLVIYDGGLQGSLTVTLRGEALPRPELSTLTALDPSGLVSTGYTANWTAAPEVIDYYVVTRLRYLPTGVESKTYQANETHLDITDRDPAVMEAYSVQSSRLGVLSEESNSIVIAAESSVGTLPETRLVIGELQGGIGVIANPDEAPVYVFDMSGNLVDFREKPRAGETILLPKGIFIVTSPSLSTPRKAAVL